MSRITEFIEYLHSHIGDAYVWGAQGELLTGMTQKELEAFVDRRETSQANEDRALKFIAKAKKDPLYAFDCNGLINFWFQNTKGWRKGDASAATLYSECTKKGTRKATTALEPGDLLFRWNGTKMNHVGVYVGDGMAIEAKGRDDGVVLRTLNASGSGYWTHYGKHPFLLADDEPAEPAKATVITLTTPYMRGDDIKALQTALNGLGYDCGEADGIAGSKTIESIQAFVAAHGGVKTVELPKTAECTVVIGGRKYIGELEV